MKCPRCGTDVSEGSTFCNQCGANLIGPGLAKKILCAIGGGILAVIFTLTGGALSVAVFTFAIGISAVGETNAFYLGGAVLLAVFFLAWWIAYRMLLKLGH